MKRLKDLSKVQIETLRSSKNSKKLTEMARNEDVQLTSAEIGHIFASETQPLEPFSNFDASPSKQQALKKEFAPYGMCCTHELQVKFISINGVSASACRWCGVEYGNDCPYLSVENGMFYCDYRA